MKLTSMTEFVLDTANRADKIEFLLPEAYFRNFRYAKFLSQPLELWMFTPCSDNGHVYSEFPEDTFTTTLQRLEYKSAQDRVLFTGFYTEWGFWPSSVSLLKIIGDTVEDAAGLGYIELTPTAIKQIL